MTTATETTWTPRELIAELRKLTGVVWEIDPQKNTAHNVKGGAVPFWFHGQGWTRDAERDTWDEPVTKDRIEFRVNWPMRGTSASRYLPSDVYGDDKPGHVLGITVASNRGVKVAAREVSRRLIEPNVAMYARLLYRKRADEEHQNGKRALAIRLAEALDKPAPSDSTYKPDEVSNWGVNFTASGPDSVRIESYGVTADVALALIAALKEATPEDD